MALGRAKIIDSSLPTDELMYAIKTFNKQYKLNELDVNLCLLKVHIRLSYKYKYISLQNYNSWCNLLTDICNMLGGWINSCQKR